MKPKERIQAKSLIKKGHTKKEVAQMLNVTEKTVGLWVEQFEQTEKEAQNLINLKSLSERINQLEKQVEILQNESQKIKVKQ